MIFCEDAGPSASRATVVLFGDSITQLSFSAGGWGQQLSEYYSRRADVLNRGYSGYNTRWARLALDRLLVKGSHLETSSLWTVWLGANDAALPDRSGAVQHVPVEEYGQNLKGIVEQIQRSCKGARVVVLSPPPIDETKLVAMQQSKGAPPGTPPARTCEASGRYAEAAKRVAAECGAEFVDVYAEMLAASPAVGEYLVDGLHLNDAGNEFVCRLLLRMLDERLPRLAVEACKFTGNTANSGTASSLPHEMPWWDRIDKAQPDKSFKSI